MSAAKNQQSASTLDEELDKFERMAEAWWDPSGDFKPLHKLNPTRVAYVRDAISQHFMKAESDKPLEGISILDVGCGGGLLCEPLKRLGAEVTGIDAVARNIEIAKLHAGQMELDIKYEARTVEEIGEAGDKFDAVVALEIIEHVAEPQAFVTACARVMKPEGLLLISTLNRTLKSYALGIVAAEYILGWLPKGTHDWDKFVKPEELARWVAKSGRDLELEGFEMTDRTGMSLNPLTDKWSLSSDLGVNYITTSKVL